MKNIGLENTHRVHQVYNIPYILRIN